MKAKYGEYWVEQSCILEDVYWVHRLRDDRSCLSSFWRWHINDLFALSFLSSKCSQVTRDVKIKRTRSLFIAYQLKIIKLLGSTRLDSRSKQTCEIGWMVTNHTPTTHRYQHNRWRATQEISCGHCSRGWWQARSFHLLSICYEFSSIFICNCRGKKCWAYEVLFPCLLHFWPPTYQLIQ